MNVTERIQLDVEITKQSPELPKWVKAIQIGERTFLFKWTYAGWKQLTSEEEISIKMRFAQ
jgi:hypothetical protein